jgi:single-stranded-DNA-specific exonuclease
MSFRWVFTQPADDAVAITLQNECNVPASIARLLSLRGVDNFDRASLFFRPDLTKLHDPFLMKDMDLASDRLAHAIRSGQRVLVYGDYDVDGTTATAIMYKFIKEFGSEPLYYIPHRFKEGYGISEDGIAFAEEKKCDLIVSVDCGITAIEEAKWARAKGIDLIICDHHTAGDTIPDALAVLDPKRRDCTYPFEGLSGAGVGFKLVQATLTKLGLPQSVAYQFLDLLAVSIASDIVPIVDENRILMREGLMMLNSKPRAGIRALMDLVKMDVGKLSTTNIVFSIGPRINAAGRMGDADTAVKLLISDDDADAAHWAEQLEEINKRRRKTDTDTMSQAMEMIDQSMDMTSLNSLVLHHPEWHLGVIGIVASRLVDQYCRPTVMLSTVDGKIKGSARSIRGFNVYNALKQCEDLLIQFGGHEFAAGLTMDCSQLDAFRERFSSISKDCLCQEQFEPEIMIDSELRLSEIDARFWKLLSQFEPYGPNNTKPVFVARNVSVVGNPSIVGKQGHLKLRLAQDDSYHFDAIGFKMHAYKPMLDEHPGKLVDVAFMLEENCWLDKRNNIMKRELQLQVRDIRVC